MGKSGKCLYIAKKIDLTSTQISYLLNSLFANLNSTIQDSTPSRLRMPHTLTHCRYRSHVKYMRVKPFKSKYQNKCFTRAHIVGILQYIHLTCRFMKESPTCIRVEWRKIGEAISFASNLQCGWAIIYPLFLLE